MKKAWWQCALLMATLLGFSSGCATHALWQESKFARFQEPANPANLRVYQSPKSSNLLVEYDESPEDNKEVRHRRAYWLQQKGEPASNPRKPHFVSLSQSQGLSAVPVYEEFTNPLPDVPLYAVLSGKGQDFKLYAGESFLAEYELPVYHKPADRTVQVFLTPVTVLADATVIGGVVAVMVAPYYWESLNCLVNK
jgi:hypothetical protein